MWFGGILLLLILAALIVLIVRAASAGSSGRAGQVPPAPASSARQIAEERLARGEITPDEFRQIARALEEHP
ncbi:SHOCT domain-containing protein [Microbacterium sp.]|nr:SHOCT domain-containing protein [Microbacterium sp.]